MASQTSYPLHGVYKTPGVCEIVGMFQCNGTSDPDQLIGGGWSVARSDVGKFTVTLDESFPVPLGCEVSIHDDGDDNDYTVHTGDLDPTSSISSFVVYTQDSGSDADIDDARVSFCLRVSWTSTLNKTRSS